MEGNLSSIQDCKESKFLPPWKSLRLACLLRARLVSNICKYTHLNLASKREQKPKSPNVPTLKSYLMNLDTPRFSQEWAQD